MIILERLRQLHLVKNFQTKEITTSDLKKTLSIIIKKLRTSPRASHVRYTLHIRGLTQPHYLTLFMRHVQRTPAPNSFLHRAHKIDLVGGIQWMGCNLINGGGVQIPRRCLRGSS